MKTQEIENALFNIIKKTYLLHDLQLCSYVNEKYSCLFLLGDNFIGLPVEEIKEIKDKKHSFDIETDHVNLSIYKKHKTTHLTVYHTFNK